MIPTPFHAGAAIGGNGRLQTRFRRGKKGAAKRLLLPLTLCCIKYTSHPRALQTPDGIFSARKRAISIGDAGKKDALSPHAPAA